MKSLARSTLVVTLGLALLLLSCATEAVAQEPERKLSLGLRANILGGTGKPVNDTLGYGIFGRYRLSERWLVGFGVDIASGFDVEEPEKFVGLVQDPSVAVIDASGESYTFMAWIEREYTRDSAKWSWFWTLGLGYASVSVDDVQGPLESGGSFDLTFDVSSEFVLSGSGGVRYGIGSTWKLEAAFRLDQRFADWQVTDRVSGATGTIDDYLIRGFTLGVVKTL
jgi:hypothetical protein